MDLVENTLAQVSAAEKAQQDILDALANGDSESAEVLSNQYQRLLADIRFAELGDPVPTQVVQALQRLQASHSKLTAITEDVQREIGSQLKQVQKGIAGSQAYRDVEDSHRR